MKRIRWFLVSNFLTDFNCQSATMAGGTDISFHVVSWLGTEHRKIASQLIFVWFVCSLSCEELEDMPQVFETTDGVYDKERKLGGLKLITGQFWALLVKRFHHARRNRKGYISQVQKNRKSKQINKIMIVRVFFYKPGLGKSLLDLWIQNFSYFVRNFHISECTHSLESS